MQGSDGRPLEREAVEGDDNAVESVPVKDDLPTESGSQSEVVVEPQKMDEGSSADANVPLHGEAASDLPIGATSPVPGIGLIISSLSPQIHYLNGQHV